MSKAMGLKAKIRNIAKNKNLPAQVILQNYMFERLLVRLSKTEYRDKLVTDIGKMVEHSKVRIRYHRQEARDDLKKAHLPKDDDKIMEREVCLALVLIYSIRYNTRLTKCASYWMI